MQPIQLPLFPQLTASFPSTRYQGSKAKLVDWLWQRISDLDFTTCLDAFGGTGAVAYKFKQAGKSVTYNDHLRFNQIIGKALIENNATVLTEEDVVFLLQRHDDIRYPDFVERTFHDIYFTDAENRWIDQTRTNITRLTNPYKQALAYFALFQACIIKRPYNLFHRKNLYIRLAEVERSFGNKASWDRPFEDWFQDFVAEGNDAVFDNDQQNTALNKDVFDLPTDHDLVYIDPPYISGRGTATDYRDFYHFLEGLVDYSSWGEHIDYRSKHLRLQRLANPWTNKHEIQQAFERLFSHFQQSIIVVSYRSDGIPSIDALEAMLKAIKPEVRVEHYGTYQYVLSKNTQSKETLLIGY